MLFSIYPTDEESIIESIVKLSLEAGEKIVYTSLHIPEANRLNYFLKLLKKYHQVDDFLFFADISPLTLKNLKLDVRELKQLKLYGVYGLRIDFGFSIQEIKQIIAQGFKVAINASVVSEQFLQNFYNDSLIGWHNYYPRPDTGLSEAFFCAQNELFKQYNIPLYTFIPGESNLRAPIYQGLPTLETQRYQNVYINALQIMLTYPNHNIVLAEGMCSRNHYQWINDLKQSKLITIPLSCIVNEEIEKWLMGEQFSVRVEETESLWRLENTRDKHIVPEFSLQANFRLKGSLQMEKKVYYRRYGSEISIMKVNKPFDINMTRIAEIPTPYLPIVDLIATGYQLKFVKV